MREERPSRRIVLAGLAASGLAGAGAAWASAPAERIVALDAPSAEMLFALNARPIAMSQPRDVAIDPAFSREGIADIGHYYEPNPQLLQDLRPDLLVRCFAAGPGVERLGRIAPLAAFPIYGTGRPTLEAARAALAGLAQRLGRIEALRAFDADFEASLTQARGMSSRRTRPFHLMTLLPDGRHVVLYGANSLFDAVIQRVGLRNAWQGPSSPWGIATVPLARIAEAPEADLAYFDGPVTDAALKALGASAIWRALPCVKAGRTVRLPALEMYGGLPTALRFARLIAGGAMDEAALG